MLDDIVIRSAARAPHAPAVRGPDGVLTYGQLDALANQVARALLGLGVQRGDRVGLWTEKSTRAVAAMQGALRLGAAYVPLDPLNPARRTRAMLEDCRIDVLVTTAARAAELRGGGLERLRFLIVDEDTGPWLTWSGLAGFSPAPLPRPALEESALAYILYTSGSTGTPKGVCISHRNALAFIEWSHALLETTPEDRFSNHAPFFFDLSVLDLYVAFLGGASVTLIPEALAFSPRQLVERVREERFTVWYSVPSALILMMTEGGLLEQAPPPFRAVLFAGEPFPIRHLRSLREHLPGARLFNLYGPTETNVCTWHEVTTLDPARTEPVPIGRASCGDRVWLARTDAPDTASDARADVGELMVEGPTVMLGYWGQEPQGTAPYATGDLCRQLPDGSFEYLGRRDHMMKVRGRRIEPGEIEAALLAHPDLREVGVVATGTGLEARLVAFVVSTAPKGPTLLQVKKHCAERLPRYMIIDELRVLTELPRTPNGKLDRRALRALAGA